MTTREKIEALSSDDKIAIIQEAIILCRWIGWVSDHRAQYEMSQLKSMLEEKLKTEIEEYT